MNAPTTSEARIPSTIVLLGASTGGPAALSIILRSLPASFPAPLVCIQHIGIDFMRSLVDWLDRSINLKVVEAQSGMLPLPGYVYFPEPGAQLEFDEHGRFLTADHAPHQGFLPSIDKTLLSAAGVFGARCAAVLLTGMGADGVAGLQEIHRLGGQTMAQHEQDCVVYGMPCEAVRAGAVDAIVHLDQIAEALQRLVAAPT